MLKETRSEEGDACVEGDAVRRRRRGNMKTLMLKETQSEEGDAVM